MYNREFGIDSRSIVIDCVELREVEPTCDELQELSSKDFPVTVVPDGIGGGGGPVNIFIWIAEYLLAPFTVTIAGSLLEDKISKILKSLRRKVTKYVSCSNVEIEPKIHLGYRGSKGNFSLDITDCLDEKSLKEVLDLYAKMVSLLSNE